MSERNLFDPEHLIRSGDAIIKSVPLSRFEGLTDRLADPVGEVKWQISASRDRYQKPRLSLELSAHLILKCQRCLGPIGYELNETRHFALFKDEASLPELADEDDDVDCMVVNGEMDAMALVEEELLLALPMMPLHDAESCQAGQGEEEEEGTLELKPSPFAMLSRLRNS
jgi:uncharacterized protein